MSTALRRILVKLPTCRVSSVVRDFENVAISLGQAVRQADTVASLNLNSSPDLLCVNLLCEKVGDPCICRLSRVLEKLHHLTSLNLANNQLVALPDSIGELGKLVHLDLSNNRLQTLPHTIQQLGRLKV